MVALLGAAVVESGGAGAATCSTGDAIDKRYCQLGGARSYLGLPRTGVYSVPGGRAHDYAGGSIYWSSATGARVVRGDILAKYKAFGGPASVLRLPTTDELSTPNVRGAYNHFSGGGSIYWSPTTGAQEIHGSIRAKWAQFGWEQGVLGFPTTDELPTPDRRAMFNHFSRAGSVYWSAATGAREVHGSIREKWRSLGWESGVLGLPTSDEFASGTGRRNTFVHGTVDFARSGGVATAQADPREFWLKEPLTSAAAWQRAFNSFHTPLWSGADGAGPVTLPDGRQGLLFGDTLQGSVGTRGAFLSSPPMVSNTLLTVDGLRMRSLPGPESGSFIPADADGAVYWPTGGVSVGNRLWLVCTRVYRTPDQGFGFRVAGTRLAAFDFPTAGEDPVFRGMFAMPGAGAFDAAGNHVGIAWDGAMAIEGSDAYVFGTRPRPMGSPLGNDLFLARVQAVALGNPAAWTYWNGTGWSSGPGTAASLLAPAGTGTPGSFSLARSGGGWVIDGKANGIFSVGISTWAAPSLTGPWTQRPDVLPAFPAKRTAGEFTYGGNRLPGFPLASGRTLFSYSRNSGEWNDLVVESNYYMPQFMEVGDPGLPLVLPPPPPPPVPLPTPPPSVPAPMPTLPPTQAPAPTPPSTPPPTPPSAPTQTQAPSPPTQAPPEPPTSPPPTPTETPTEAGQAPG